MQPYPEKVNKRNFCQAFSRLRISSHRLEIESGRWTRPISTPLDDRKCSFICNVLEDEFHFVLECNMFAELRKNTFLGIRYYWSRPSMHKLISLVNNDNETCIRKLSTFIFKL